MTLLDFFNKVEADPELTGKGLTTESVVVQGPRSKWKIPLNTIEEGDWDTLRALLHDEREPDALSHMTRIVGYYSKLQDWNQSKIGELRDRHVGNYAIQENVNVPS